MAEFDVEAVILETVRRQSGNAAAGANSRFAEDLGMSEIGRKALFAFMTEAFTARGVNLPARGFYQTDFLACRTPAEVHAAVRDAMSGVRKKSASPAAQKAKPAAAGAMGAAAAPKPATAASAQAGGPTKGAGAGAGAQAKPTKSKGGSAGKGPAPKRGKRR